MPRVACMQQLGLHAGGAVSPKFPELIAPGKETNMDVRARRLEISGYSTNEIDCHKVLYVVIDTFLFPLGYLLLIVLFYDFILNK